MTYYDKNGYPIQPGDLLRSYHYQDRKTRRKLYLYHTVNIKHYGDRQVLWMIPTSFLHTKEEQEGQKLSCDGACSVAAVCYADGRTNAEIVYSVGDAYWFEREKAPPDPLFLP